MTINDLKEYYGSGYRFNKDTHMSASSFMNWNNRGYIPWGSQLIIERLTEGKLKADKQDMRKAHDLTGRA